MALTMTRTRTQTALTKLVTMVANVHGELAFVEGVLLAEETAGRRETLAELTDEQRKGLAARHSVLLGQGEALYATVRQFDSELNPEDIGVLDEWKKALGRACSNRVFQVRYALAVDGGKLR